MRSVNTVVIPEYSTDMIVKSVQDAYDQTLKRETASKQTALDFIIIMM